MFKVENMKSERTGNKVANQFVIKFETSERNVIVFQSYESTIIGIDLNRKAIKIFKDYKFSRTTMKYRNQFLMEHGFSGIANSKELEKAIKNGMYEDWKIVMEV